jgi:pectate lyase C
MKTGFKIIFKSTFVLCVIFIFAATSLTADTTTQSDKVIVGSGGSDPSPDDLQSDDTADYEITSEGTIHVFSGTFDGQGENYGDVGDGSQDESQPAVFELEPGANLKNCTIVPPAGDGIHVHGENVIENVTFTDVGEDAISMRSNAEGGTVTIRNCSFANADDKVFQVNKESTWYLYDLTVNGAGKVMRQNGGKTFKLDVYIDGLEAYDIDEAIVRSDSPDCTVYYKNITTDLPTEEWWRGELAAVPW